MTSIPIRQPIQYMLCIVATEKEKQHLKRMSSLIVDEVNIKEVFVFSREKIGNIPLRELYNIVCLAKKTPGLAVDVVSGEKLEETIEMSRYGM